jgi:hypothetical protein
MMLTLYTLRTGEQGTFSELLMGNERLCVTCEDPWNDNKTDISCIPAGEYRFVKRVSPKYGHHWHILDVPGRSLILIHWGNTIEDTRGCVLVGSQFGKLDGVQAILNSIATMEMLRQTLPDEGILKVIRPWP